MDDPIVVLHQQFTEVLSVLDAANEPSLRIASNDMFRKALVLSAASRFEHSVVSALLSSYKTDKGSLGHRGEFVKRQALDSKYHTLFDWRANNANRFLKLFGDEWSDSAKNELANDGSLEQSVRDFISIGNTRNILVHNDFGVIQFDDTLDDILRKYKSAQAFVTWIATKASAMT